MKKRATDKSPSEIGDLLCSRGQISATKAKWGYRRLRCEHGEWASNGKLWRHAAYNVTDAMRRFYRRKRWAIEYLGGVCVNCGTPGNDEMGSLEFDHIDPNRKEFNVGRQLGWARERLIPELDKCQLLHVECHKAKTAQERGMDATAKQDQLDALLNQYGSEAV